MLYLYILFGYITLTQWMIFSQKTKNLNPIEVKAYKFFDSVTGKYFPVKGVDYYPRPNAGPLDAVNKDLFTKEYAHIWSRDIPYLAQLGANTIRIYAVDPTANHDAFMCALSAHGLYAIIDMNAACENCAITKADAPACYPKELRTRGEMVINAFAKYTNVLAFSAGNEINHVQTSKFGNAPCQKKYLLDMRTYMASCSGLRQVPIGVVLADTDRLATAQYYNCIEEDKKEQAQWYGLNAYLHCDGKVPATPVGAGYQELKKDLMSVKYSIPFILSEYGCIDGSFPTVDGYKAQRNFYDAKWIFSKDLIEQIQGGLVFEYNTENENSKADSPYPFTSYGKQNYGLGYFKPENCDDVDVKCQYQKMPNYNSLAAQYNSTDVSGQPTKDSFQPLPERSQPSVCPSTIAKPSKFEWESDGVNRLKCSTVKTYQCSTNTNDKISGGDNNGDDSDPTNPKNFGKNVYPTLILLSIPIMLFGYIH